MVTADYAPFSPPATDLDEYLPEWTHGLKDLQTAIPDLAKDSNRLAELGSVLGEIPTVHRSVHGDARLLSGIKVLDPFSGTGTTTIAAIGCGRNSIGYEIDDHYVSLARRRILNKTKALLSHAVLETFDLC